MLVQVQISDSDPCLKNLIVEFPPPGGVFSGRSWSRAEKREVITYRCKTMQEAFALGDWVGEQAPMATAVVINQ